MVGQRLDPSPWNLGVPLALLAACGPMACGPIVAVGDTDTGSATEDPTATTNDPSTMTTPTSPGTTVNPTTPTGCVVDVDCPVNYRCDNGSCYYNGYCDDGECCYDTCCGDECGWYDECSYTSDCPPGQQCLYNGCAAIPSEDVCASVPFGIAFDIPVAGVASLAFVESDSNAERELLMGGTGVTLARIDGTSTIIDESSFAYDLDVRDLDGDGDGDVVVANLDSSSPRVLYNDGAWTAFDLAPGGYAELVATVDFEGDGYPDVLGSSAIDGLYLWPNAGPGGWGDPVDLVEGAASIATGPLDGDSFEDFVTASYWIAAWYGGPNTQTYELFNGTSGSNRRVAIGNFDGSGDRDVIVLEPSGSGTVATTWPGPVLQSSGWASTWWPNSVEVQTVADVNLDGFDDIVGGGATLTVGYGGSAGSPDTIVCVSSVETAIEPRFVAVGDMSGDGRPDIAVSDGQSVQVMLRTD